jgi:AraC family transcriptional regulator
MFLPQSQPAADPEISPLIEPNRSLGTDVIHLEHLYFPPGEGEYQQQEWHSLFIHLNSRPLQYLQQQDGKTHTGLYRPGEMLITPAQTPLFVRWAGQEDCLHIQISVAFLQRVAEETLNQNSDRLYIVPTFQSQNRQIEAIVTLLLGELQQREANGPLYLDSLANVLAVQLLRHYGTTHAALPHLRGGLSAYQLNQVLDYIDATLDTGIKLADLAGVLGMSPFHFSRMFKQSLGISPHQYLIQQRVERAKHLLQDSDRPLIEIALACGFNSHSHLSKQFRQVTGITPKLFRASRR